MEVILLERIEKLGHIGDVVKVKVLVKYPLDQMVLLL